MIPQSGLLHKHTYATDLSTWPTLILYLRQICAIFFFLKMGYSTKGYYCRLWDFKLVNVTSNFAQCGMDHFTLINLKIKLDLYQDQCLAHF